MSLQALLCKSILVLETRFFPDPQSTLYTVVIFKIVVANCKVNEGIELEVRLTEQCDSILDF